MNLPLWCHLVTFSYQFSYFQLKAVGKATWVIDFTLINCENADQTLHYSWCWTLTGLMTDLMVRTILLSYNIHLLLMWCWLYVSWLRVRGMFGQLSNAQQSLIFHDSLCVAHVPSTNVLMFLSRAQSSFLAVVTRALKVESCIAFFHSGFLMFLWVNGLNNASLSWL